MALKQIIWILALLLLAIPILADGETYIYIVSDGQLIMIPVGDGEFGNLFGQEEVCSSGICISTGTSPSPAFHDSQLMFILNCISNDPATIYGNCQIYNGSTPYDSVSTLIVENNTNSALCYVPTYTATKGETWRAEMWCSNNVSQSNITNTTDIIISNSKPYFLNANYSVVVAPNTYFSNQVQANDIDGDTLYYSSNNVSGISIDSATGLIQSLGIQNDSYVYVSVSDGQDTTSMWVSFLTSADCSPDLVKAQTTCYIDEYGINKRNVSYYDNNYYTCCAVTGLPEDCAVNFAPFNVTTQELCQVINNNTNMECDVNTFTEYNSVGSDETSWLCRLDNPNTTATCKSYVKDTIGGIIQINPSYNQKSDSVVSLIGNKVEDRTSFTSENGLVTATFSKENLIFDGRQYIYGVECSDGITTARYEYATEPEYSSLSSPVTLWFWIDKNHTGLITGGVILLLASLVIGLIYRKVRGR